MSPYLLELNSIGVAFSKIEQVVRDIKPRPQALYEVIGGVVKAATEDDVIGFK